jgi:hypothetical protein
LGYKYFGHHEKARMQSFGQNKDGKAWRLTIAGKRTLRSMQDVVVKATRSTMRFQSTWIGVAGENIWACESSSIVCADHLLLSIRSHGIDQGVCPFATHTRVLLPQDLFHAAD